MSKQQSCAGDNSFEISDDKPLFDEIFDYRSFMSSISSTLKKDDEILDSSFFDALMNYDAPASEEAVNAESINTQKILNQLMSSNNVEVASVEPEITNEQIDMLLQSSNLLSSSSGSSSSDAMAIARRVSKRRRYTATTYENDDSLTQDGTIDNESLSDNDDDDDEEYDESSNGSSLKRKAGRRSRSTRATTVATNAAKRTTRRRRSSIDSNSNKKESNKEAATRYRIKKLSEKDQLFETKTLLERQNDDTKKRIDHVQTEINYLKNLLCQVLMTKGILSS